MKTTQTQRKWKCSCGHGAEYLMEQDKNGKCPRVKVVQGYCQCKVCGHDVDDW